MAKENKMPKCPTFQYNCPYCDINGKCNAIKPEETCETFWWHNKKDGQIQVIQEVCKQ